MAYKKKTTKTTTNKGGTKRTTVEINRMSKRDADLKAQELATGSPSVQKARVEQQGKTSRARAYAAGATASTASVASAAGDDQTVVYEGMASGGLGTTEPGNVQPDGGSGSSNPSNPSGIVITQ